MPKLSRREDRVKGNQVTKVYNQDATMLLDPILLEIGKTVGGG